MSGPRHRQTVGEEIVAADRDETLRIPAAQNIYLWAISFVAALGGLLFGYDWVVIGGAKPFYEKFFHLTGAAQQGWAMSCALIGCLLGAVISGSLSDRYGRKRLLILAALLFGVSSAGTARANVFHSFVMWRIVGGMAIGLASNLSPMYIAEISPAAVRGRLVSLNQLTVVIEILLAQSVNWLIAQPVPAGACDRDSELMEWPDWVALDVWRHRDTVPAIFSRNAGSAGEPALASPEWTAGESRARPRSP